MPTDSPTCASTWDAIAPFWDHDIGISGNNYWSRLQEPCLQRLLGHKLAEKECTALELCCGNGLGARWLASRGANVFATDGSNSMIERARLHGNHNGLITFGSTLDVTKVEDFKTVLEHAESIGGFDIALMNMAIQDVSTLDPLAAALPALLKKDGVFVAQLLHPVFMTSTYSRQLNVSFNPETGASQIVNGKLITEYLDIAPYKGIATASQPVPHTYFHRPMHELLGAFFKHGLVVDALEEPSFTDDDYEPDRIQSTTNFPQLPAILAFRVRRP